MKLDEVKDILSKLSDFHKNPRCELDFTTPYELLVAVILSAQCTDVRVNMVTSKLFLNYNTAHSIAAMSPQLLMEYIKPCGLYRNKAYNIINASKKIISEYNNTVPNTLEQLLTLDGVGRKTANVILSVAYNVPSIAVDTHVYRVSRRIGLAISDNVLDVEHALMNIIPYDMWSASHHLLIHHGRYVCKAKKPLCDLCNITQYCRYYNDKES